MSYRRAPVQETSFDLQPDTKSTYSLRSAKSFRSYIDNKEEEGGCDACLTRVPYATLIATVMCALGVVVFCSTMYRGGTLSVLMFRDIFKQTLFWIDAVKMTFVIIGACMGALGLMILTVGCLATGATRYKVYKAWKSRVSGRVFCAVFMGITYILHLAWIALFAFLVIVTFCFTVFWKMCENPDVASFRVSIDLTQFYFLFPEGTRQEHMKITGEHDVKLFCKDYVEKVELMFILASVSCVLIILSLVHYLMCLSANYAHIRDHEKFQELQDLQMLSDNDVLAGKERF